MAGKTTSRESQNEAPVGNRPSESKSSPPMKLILYFAVAVVIGLALQKAIPAVDVALSCHAKVVCSAHFVGHRPLDSIDIGSECSPIVKWISSAHVNAVEHLVESTTLFSTLKQSARFLGMYRGCALVGTTPHGPEPPRQRKFLIEESEAWPVGNTVDLSRDDDQAELAVAVDVAFEPFKVGDYNTRELVVVQNGKVVYEWYAPGFTPETALLGWSMSKTLMASLIGIRIGEGALSLSDKAVKWFPEWAIGNRSEIKIDDLLTMQSGLQWHEGYSIASGEVVPMVFKDESCSERPRKSKAAVSAGTAFSYASGTTNLLSEILRANMRYDEAYWTYPSRMLFEPIGARSMVMEVDRVGTFNAAAFSYATARDWARIGLLFLNDGVWVDGKRVLPAGWVKYATTPRPTSFGVYGAHFWLGGTQANPDDIDYDHDLQAHAKASRRLSSTTFTMTGFAGQFVSVIPEKNTVIVRLARDFKRINYGELISNITSVLP